MAHHIALEHVLRVVAGRAVVPDMTAVTDMVLAAAVLPLTHALPVEKTIHEHAFCGSTNTLQWPGYSKAVGSEDCVAP